MLAKPGLGEAQLFNPFDQLEIAAQANGRALGDVVIRGEENAVLKVYPPSDQPHAPRRNFQRLECTIVFHVVQSDEDAAHPCRLVFGEQFLRIDRLEIVIGICPPGRQLADTETDGWYDQ